MRPAHLTGSTILALALSCGACEAVEVHPAWEAGLGGLRGGLGNFESVAGGLGGSLCLLVDLGDGHLLRPRVSDWVFIRSQQMGNPTDTTTISHTADLAAIGLDYLFLPDGNVNSGLYLVGGAGLSRNRVSLDLPVPQTQTYALFHVSGTSTKPCFDLGVGYQFNSVAGMEFRYEASRWVSPQDQAGQQTYRMNMLKGAATFRF